MTLETATGRRHPVEDPAPWGWGWLLDARAWLAEEIHDLSAGSDDPRELTDAAELLTFIDKKLRLRGLD